MSNPADFLSAQFLAEHQYFVRRLALGLARDEAGAEDLAQETWLAALTNRSQEIVNPRAWLATAVRRRAMNLARAENVRREHEVRAARTEAAEEELLHERVHFQHSIVAAVLALDEPYRSVVMLRYFQDLSPAAIARRKKIPAATVRSQLARAHAQLRARLEAREGGREAWCLALAGFIDSSKPALISAPALAIAASLCATMSVAGGAWMWTHRESPAIESALAIGEPVAAPEALVEPSFESARVAVMAAATPLRRVAFEEGPSDDELAAKSLDELRDMVTRVEDELRIRLLSPPAEVTAAWSLQHPGVQMEFARLLDGSKFQERLETGVVGIRAGGAFYSFVTRSNSYDEEPTINLGRGTLGGAFYGASQAVLIDLGALAPVDVPAKLATNKAEAFAVLSRGPALPKESTDSQLRSMLDGRKFEHCALALHHTYLLRSVYPHQHDLLAIFVPIQESPFGITLAWRVLQSWPVPEPRTGYSSGPTRKSLIQEPWITALSTDGLLLLFDRVRLLTTARLMAIPDSLVQSWPNRPLARVLRDYWGTRFVNIDGGGRYFNFATQSHSFQDDPDIALQDGRIDGYMNTGILAVLVDVGVTSVDTLGSASAPPTNANSRLAWELAWTFERSPASSSAGGSAIVTSEDFARFRDRAISMPKPAVVGHTYLVRSIVMVICALISS